MATRILVVEDDADQLEMRKLILENAGYAVATAQNASQALDQLHGCQLVLMDLRLPAPEDGQRLIKAASGSAKIIVLSGDAETGLPVDAFLNKPCSSKKLLETIARFCLLLISLCVVLRAGTFTVSKTGEVVAELDMRVSSKSCCMRAPISSPTPYFSERSPQVNIDWITAARAWK